MLPIPAQIAQELSVHPRQIEAAIALLDGGATVPFIARYRKEATEGLDDTQLRTLEQRLLYLRELDTRRQTILKSIADQGKLQPGLAQALQEAQSKQALEDLYLPYKPKRRSKAAIAREHGLEPLALSLWADPGQDPVQAAQAYLQPSVHEDGSDFTSTATVLDGARDLLAERWAEDAALLQGLREWAWQEGQLRSEKVADKNEHDPEVAKFRDYWDYQEPVCRVPSHRALAVLRGRGLDILAVRVELPTAALPPGSPSNLKPPSLAEGRIARHLGWSHQNRAADDWLRKCIAWTWRIKLGLATERDVLTRLREASEQVAIDVFGHNLRDLLLAAPAGAKAVLGLDPGIRTGVKVAVVDATGKLLETTTVYPHEPRRDWQGSLAVLARLCLRHQVALVAIGNGTASRETDRLASELLAGLAAQGLGLQKVVVSEAGASVYSASEYAATEMPDVDVSLRGAASIARRLQDPLAELVKIDPKSIGVGQYQHDVNQHALARTLDTVVEDCVNAVGVDLNTASAPLLARVSGLSQHVAKAIVQWRETHGRFQNRQQLRQVAGLGQKTFEQSAGFLRIRGGDNPLDLTGVHPETYPLVQRLLQQIGLPIGEVMGHPERLRALKPQSLVDERFGLLTVQDIVRELEKPGRDPRPDFKVARFNEGIEDIRDLKPGMVLEGTVSNVAQFGAFVDLGVHQDGLVHVSQLARKFVTDARDVVKTGDIVSVKVLEVDLERKRIALTMRPDAPPSATAGQGTRGSPRPAGAAARPNTSTPSAMASAFAKLQALKP